MEPKTQLAPWHTEQNCRNGESLETCRNLSVSEIEMKKISEVKYGVTKIKRTKLQRKKITYS